MSRTRDTVGCAICAVCGSWRSSGDELGALGSIIVSLQYGRRKLVMRITDFGHPFEPCEPPEPDPQAVLSGRAAGFGLYFIYRSVDSVGYEVTESGNTLTLVKDLGSGEK